MARLAALLMVIGAVGCDNVEWGGIELAVQRPPPRAAGPESEIEAADRLPESPILYYVRRDSLRAEVFPVAEVEEDGLAPLVIPQNAESYGTRFISAFLREGAELTLFRHGRRAGTLIVDSARVPTGNVCRLVPRGVGHVELSGAAGEATEFLAMARTQAPQGRMLPGEALEADRRMRVLGPMIAERALRARNAQLPNWSAALRQLQPFPVSEARDMGFTATFLVDDELQVGNDSLGYSLFLVAVPEGQAGYDTAYVSYTSYPQSGKAAPRVIDFLDWDRDGSAELLLEVYGTRNSWFEAVGRVGDEWRRILQDRCDAPAPAPVADTVPPDTAAPVRTPSVPAQPRPQPRRPPAADTARPVEPVPDIRPQVRLTPGTRPRPQQPPPDTSGGRAAPGRG